MIKKSFIFILLVLAMSSANAYLCFGSYTYSPNYSFESTCEWDRVSDFIKGKTYNLSCDKGIFYYYYCKKKE